MMIIGNAIYEDANLSSMIQFWKFAYLSYHFEKLDEVL